MWYSFQEQLLSIMLTVYVSVCVMGAVIRWGHKCSPYAKHIDYYYPAWRTTVFCFLTNLLLCPVIFLTGEPDAVYQLRMMLILSSPFLCATLIFSYFGRLLHLAWWRKLIYALAVPYLLISIAALVITLLPGTQLQGKFLFWFFIVGGVLALFYLVCFVLALRMIIRVLRRFSEENYSNPDDFPIQYAESVLWIPVLHLIMSWSTTFNGDKWALSFGLFILSILSVVFLLGVLSPHRAVEVDQLEAGEAVTEPEELPDIEPKVAPEPEAVEALSPEKKEEIFTMIRQEVEGKKAYLDNHLTLASLSRRCGINRTYISQVLSERLGGFFSYINQCRLAHAEAFKVAHPKADVDEISLVSGFNSRQSYYNARKRLNK